MFQKRVKICLTAPDPFTAPEKLRLGIVNLYKLPKNVVSK
jgi:hypothetical protein